MTTLEEQILETWRINNRINLHLIKNVPQKAFQATLSTHGGRNIARQFAHVQMNRALRLKTFARKSGVRQVLFDQDESPSRARLTEAFQQSGALMEDYLRVAIQNGGIVPNFKLGLVPMLGHLISHEAHHRGSILLTLKQCGFKLSEALKWDIWMWNKF